MLCLSAPYSSLRSGTSSALSLKAARKAACCARCVAPPSLELIGSYLG